MLRVFVSPLRIAAIVLASLAAARAAAQAPAQWLAGDFHHHSFLTDGGFPAPVVFDKGLNAFGLSWIINSEHGGAFSRDPKGRFWDDPSRESPVEVKGGMRLDSKKHRQMWRWQSLSEHSWPAVAAARKDPRFAGKAILQGFEFNCPAFEHVSTGIVADSGLPLAEFEYRFDANDADTSGGPGGRWTGKNTVNDRVKAMQAIAWLRANYGGRSWFIVNHPERRNKYKIQDLREFNDLAPDVAFGFEGAPGHQKAKDRGEYGDKSFYYADDRSGGSTYGGVGVWLARVGGAWDSLLGEGRRLFVFANSDFHEDVRDYFPGQYAKTYIRVQGTLSPEAILDALRAGRSFFTAGDLVDGVDLTVTADGRRASIGDTLDVARNSDVVVTVSWRDLAGANALGDVVSVDHVDLIGGKVTGRIPRGTPGTTTTNPAYGTEVNPTTRVLATFGSRGAKIDANGWATATFTVPKIDGDMYLRLRGTNHAPGTANETDAAGNPLNDDLAAKRGLEGDAEARADLWFYTNPVFVHVR